MGERDDKNNTASQSVPLKKQTEPGFAAPDPGDGGIKDGFVFHGFIVSWVHCFIVHCFMGSLFHGSWVHGFMGCPAFC